MGQHPLQLHSLATPNGVKITVILEEFLALEVSEAEYDAWERRSGAAGGVPRKPGELHRPAAAWRELSST